MNNILIYFSKKYKGDWDAIYKALEEKERVPLAELNAIEQEIKDKKLNIITILDIDYPNKLKEAYKPPFVVYYEGDKKILEDKLLAVTGNQLDEVTKKRISDYAPEIVKSNVIVTSNFKGVDEEIKKVTANKPRVIVSAAGLDQTPRERVNDHDFIITEYPAGTKASKLSYRNRNRLVGALSESLILFSSIKDGPINNLVTDFLNLGKELYCFPGNGDEMDGNSELIEQGSNLITKIKDISGPEYDN